MVDGMTRLFGVVQGKDVGQGIYLQMKIIRSVLLSLLYSNRYAGMLLFR